MNLAWNEQGSPIGVSIDQLLYRIRSDDGREGLIFDSVTLNDILSEDGVEQFVFDAMVTPFSRLRRKMEQMLKVMNRAVEGLDVTAMQVSDPFRRNGVAQVAAVFELSDGQTVTVYFHNPDSTPNKLTPTDEMVSWKWMLNKKDITIVVAPEKGRDLAVREVSRRIMRLAERNSQAFARQNARRAERLERIQGLKDEIGELEQTLEQKQRDLELARVEAESRALAQKELSAEEGMTALNGIKRFLSRAQYRTIAAAMKGEEKQFFIDKARLLADIINGMAETYEQDGKGMDATAYLHYFKGGADWYITEKDSQGGTQQAFGWANLGHGGELGYISIDELTQNNAELDLHFDPQPLNGVVEDQESEPAADSGNSADNAPMNAAIAMVETVIGEFDGSLSGWERDESFSGGAWSFTNLTFGGVTVRAGVSYGGVVSLDGKPHDPEGRVIDSADSLRAAIVAMLPKDEEQQQTWNASTESVRELDDEQFAAALAELEADNLRSEAVLLLARRKGTDEQIAEAEQILQEYNDAGHASAELIARRDALRNAIEQGVSEPESASEDLQPEGAESVVKTAKGSEVITGFSVVEAAALIASHDADGNPNPAYPQELQPRDRSRTSSVAWVKKTANQLDPDSLGKTRRADSGAPIVGPDLVVESGNGRTMAIQEAYRTGKAEEYRQWLQEEAEFYGLNAGKVAAMKAPVLVRIRTSAIDRRQFAIEANQDDKLAMTGTEKAKADADRLDSNLMARLSDDGNLLSAANRDFVAGFLASLGESESAQYVTTNGQPTGALIARIQAAIFAKAYSDDRLLELSADASKPEVANIIEALNVAAPEFILARSADEAGAEALSGRLVDSVEASMNEQAVEAIIQAANLVRKAKSEGASVEETVNQLGLFGDVPPATAAMALFINRNNRSAKRLGVAFKAMAEFVRQEAERGQTVDMFGDATEVTLQEIIDAANRKLEQEYGEGAFAIESLDLFAQSQPESDPEQALQKAREQTDTDPTDRQKENGDYQKGELSAFSLELVIENPKGHVRSGKSENGDEWSVSMAHDYGYIKGTKGLDGDEVDAFIGPNLESEKAFVIEQVDPSGKLDEHKVMLGFDDEESAKQGYLSSYKAGWDGLGSIREMSLEELKAWLPNADQSTNDESSVNQEGEPSPAEADTAFLQSVIDGAVPDMLAPELGDEIAAVLERHADNPDMEALLEQAVMAYQTAMLNATANIE
ncbi:hypothetical protein PU634_05215 [Oceanimonas pelagia]|uniref:DdrB-like domain-containing protein n=1 Tax=Oceanimonas pelagia TaxID=3028314 RepID=A0AA50QB74_9GAMM|nr:hypothetical protein [Oceanimonas pelagia]WMC11768.1 hypothetical protein PU634_05215 [Oceanimonas pelagia]